MNKNPKHLKVQITNIPGYYWYGGFDSELLGLTFDVINNPPVYILLDTSHNREVLKPYKTEKSIHELLNGFYWIAEGDCEILHATNKDAKFLLKR